MGAEARQRGFTLIEMLLSVSIIAVVSALSLPLYQSMQNQNDLDVAAQQLSEALRRAQLYSRGPQNDSLWSVEIQAASVTLFQGNNFGGRDTSYDEVIPIPSGVAVSGLTEVQFAKITGIPNTGGVITLTSTRTNDVETVTINAKGMVEN